MASGNKARRRGRPSRSSQAQPVSGGLSDTVRQELSTYVGVCETCGHNIRPVQPIAQEIGVNPVILSKFIRGTAGVSLATLDRIYMWLENRKAEDEATAEAPASA